MAMSLTFRRNRWLIPFCAVVLLTLIYFWDKRVISVNVWDKWEVTTDYYDIENTIDLFDTTQVHKIEINMTEEEYKDMIDTYSSTSEKDWYKTDITIDWVTIYNVWVRLKWNSSLRWLWWGNECHEEACHELIVENESTGMDLEIIEWCDSMLTDSDHEILWISLEISLDQKYLSEEASDHELWAELKLATILNFLYS